MKSSVRLDLVGRLPREPGGSVGHMTLHGSLVCLVNDAGLQWVDVSDPAAPAVVGSYKPKASLGPVAASGDHVYVAEKANLLRVLDASDPARPRAVGSRKLPDTIRGLAVAGGYAYVSLSESLHVLDVSSPASPKAVGVCDGLELAGLVTADGAYAYVSADFNGMRILDVSEPAAPKEVGSFEGPGNVTQITVAGRYAYLANYTGGMYVVDIADRRSPREVSRYGDFLVGEVALAGRYALLAAGELHVVDISKPDRPRKAGAFSQPDCDTAWSVAASGGHVYSISDAGLFVFRLVG